MAACDACKSVATALWYRRPAGAAAPVGPGNAHTRHGPRPRLCRGHQAPLRRPSKRAAQCLRPQWSDLAINSLVALALSGRSLGGATSAWYAARLAVRSTCNINARYRVGRNPSVQRLMQSACYTHNQIRTKSPEECCPSPTVLRDTLSPRASIMSPSRTKPPQNRSISDLHPINTAWSRLMAR